MQTLAREMNSPRARSSCRPNRPTRTCACASSRPAGAADGGASYHWQHVRAGASGASRQGATRWVFGLGVGPTPVELRWEGDRPAVRVDGSAPPEFPRRHYLGPTSFARRRRPAGVMHRPAGRRRLCGCADVWCRFGPRGGRWAGRSSRDAAADERVPGGHIGVFVFSAEPVTPERRSTAACSRQRWRRRGSGHRQRQRPARGLSRSSRHRHRDESGHGHLQGVAMGRPSRLTCDRARRTARSPACRLGKSRSSW